MKRFRCVLIALALWPSAVMAQEVGPGFEFVSGPSSVAVAGDGAFVVAWENGYPPWAIRGRLFDASGAPVGADFQVSDPVVGARFVRRPAVAADEAGNFTVVWQKGAGWSGPAFELPRIAARRFAANGTPLGAEFRVDTYNGGHKTDVAIASDAAGNSVVVWTSSVQEGPSADNGIYGQRLDPDGTKVGGEFQVNTHTTDFQIFASVAFLSGGDLVVAWQSRGRDGDDWAICARRYDASGAPAGDEFLVNTITAGAQAVPAVTAADAGGFAVAWVSFAPVDEGGPGVFARRYDAAGNPLGPEFRVAREPGIRVHQRSVSASPDGRGGYAIAWVGNGAETLGQGGAGRYVRRYDGAGRPGAIVRAEGSFVGTVRSSSLASNTSGDLVALWHRIPRGFPSTVVQRFGATWPEHFDVDTASSPSANGNGVIEPGEAVAVAPRWLDGRPAGSVVTASVGSFTGPGGPLNPAYLILDGAATYEPVGTLLDCAAAADCYRLGVSAVNPRPRLHMDAALTEELPVGGRQVTRAWPMHVGASFQDVSTTSPCYRSIETLLHHALAGGCDASRFCPDASVTREQIAPVLVRARGASWVGFPQDLQIFDDVPLGSPFRNWILHLWNLGIVSGCDENSYCPSDAVTRAQMVTLALRTLEALDYAPPPCTSPMFSDVPCSDPFAPWVNEGARRGITAGCGGGLFCPGAPVTREQMAVFVTRTFGLTLSGPRLHPE